jgi:hypothetical protein
MPKQACLAHSAPSTQHTLRIFLPQATAEENPPSPIHPPVRPLVPRLFPDRPYPASIHRLLSTVLLVCCYDPSVPQLATYDPREVQQERPTSGRTQAANRCPLWAGSSSLQRDFCLRFPATTCSLPLRVAPSPLRVKGSDKGANSVRSGRCPCHLRYCELFGKKHSGLTRGERRSCNDHGNALKDVDGIIEAG